MSIEEIIKVSTTYVDGSGRVCHESLLRSFQIVHKVLEMVERGDSKETIREVVEFLKSARSYNLPLEA